MATHTQIIEFFGLPACGKSTLCDALLENQTSGSTTFCRMNAISSEYRKTNALLKIIYFPYRASFFLLWLILKSSPSRSSVRIYKSFLSILIIYAYCKHTRKYDYMLIDHGVLQSVVSLFYGARPGQFDSSIEISKCLVDSICIDFPIYCDISIPTSMGRLRKRNRLDSGRLDVIKSDKELEAAMTAQEIQFKAFLSNQTIKRIDMVKPIDQCKIDLLNLISK